jgi:hypothetical protein
LLIRPGQLPDHEVDGTGLGIGDDNEDIRLVVVDLAAIVGLAGPPH